MVKPDGRKGRVYTTRRAWDSKKLRNTGGSEQSTTYTAARDLDLAPTAQPSQDPSSTFPASPPLRFFLAPTPYGFLSDPTQLKSTPL